MTGDADAGVIRMPKWILAVAVPLMAAILGAVAAVGRYEVKTTTNSEGIQELRQELRAHMQADEVRHAASQEHRFKLSQQIQWLCIQRARDNAREGAGTAGQCP